ncbi:hypothetical protein RvY_11648 [Ramazzottius varieornatus]|uniref:Uncharacterized protein n=1 Tax=Ramazzottius varieornatus TaxID=947166 RepID=A0A1D1VGS7_RAMVA|nr:hypothetical protein RvY_11648 [Ramazzottius varieornatus]
MTDDDNACPFPEFIIASLLGGHLVYQLFAAFLMCKYCLTPILQRQMRRLVNSFPRPDDAVERPRPDDAVERPRPDDAVECLISGYHLCTRIQLTEPSKLMHRNNPANNRLRRYGPKNVPNTLPVNWKPE